MDNAKSIIASLTSLQQRKSDLGIGGRGRDVRRSLSSLDYDRSPSMLQQYLATLAPSAAA